MKALSSINKFDVLFFNDTNFMTTKPANGTDDLILDGFQGPIIQDPIRSMGKGGV